MPSCDSNDSQEGIVPEFSIPSGDKNYFEEDLTLNTEATETKITFQINVDWTIEILSNDVRSTSSWCSATPSSGSAGLNEVLIKVEKNDTGENRSAMVRLMSGENPLAEITVSQEAAATFSAIDLGLSVEWAPCHIGATTQEECGKYYSWGEIEEKADYSWETYKWCNGSNDSVTKYCTDSSYGTIDGKTTLEAEDDVATVELGEDWRIPTIAEFQELLNNCAWTWCSVNGIYGYKVSGNGNTIFLPAAGCRYYDETEARYVSELGCYWSSSSTASDHPTSYAFSFEEDDFMESDNVSRYPGLTIRPVKAK